MKTLTYASLCLTLSGLTALAGPSICRAQGLRPGIGVEKTTTNPQDIDHPGLSNVADLPTLFQDALNKTWLSNKPKIDQAICDGIAYGNQHGFFPKGYTLYHQKSSVATSGTPQVQLVGSNIVVGYLVPHNYLETTTTVPANVVGSGADPRFSFTYDLTVSLTIPLADVARGLQVVTATATISNVSAPDSHNFTADLGVSVAAIIKAFGGPDFAAQFQKSLNGTQVPLTRQFQQQLTPVNSSLQQLARQGYALLSPVVDTAQHLLVLRTAFAENPVRLTLIRLNDQVEVDPKYRNLIRTYAKVRFFGKEVVGKPDGPTVAFARNIPPDVRTVPIHIDIQRDVRLEVFGSGATRKVEPEGVTGGIVRSIDLTYDRSSGRITGAFEGALGADIGVLADRIQGVTFTIKLTDNGPKPPSRLKDRPTDSRFPRP